MTKKEQRLLDWQDRIADYQASGLTMVAWCQQHSFTKETLKYWLRKMKAPLPPVASAVTPHWLSLSVSSDTSLVTSSLVVRVGHASIEIKDDFDPHLLRKVVQALDSSC